MAIDTEQKRRFVAEVYAPPPDGSLASVPDRRQLAGVYPYATAGDPPAPGTPTTRRRRGRRFVGLRG